MFRSHKGVDLGIDERQEFFTSWLWLQIQLAVILLWFNISSQHFPQPVVIPKFILKCSNILLQLRQKD
jgi:hypothetical protein